ncbi:hypothetical protein [Nocardioides sp. SR21]|uniref:hypothetical protein n=1 Tax=Nocardioides sp. SR21 TaxID=2919501 RepID=UPI001FAA2B2F|nr:hypothetical protein [Nocardioides sp. SR21]
MRATILMVVVLLLAGCSGSDDAGPEQARAASSATKCDGTVRDIEIEGDLLVARKKTCTLEGVTVEGRVTVSRYATLVARDTHFDDGISAHEFDRVEVRGGSSGGTPVQPADFLFDGGGDVVLRDAPVESAYYVLHSTGKVEIVGLSLIEGSVYCAGNTRRPEVRDISAESPGVLKGQCAGLKNFGVSDF